MRSVVAVAHLELIIVRRNLWLAMSTVLMLAFAIVLTIAGTASAGNLGVDHLTVAVTSLTTLAVYLVPLIALLLSFDAIVGDVDRGTLALNLSYPTSRFAFLVGKFLAHLATMAVALGVGFGAAGILSVTLGEASPQALASLALLYASALLLGATFLGIGYAASGLARQTGAAAGLCVGVWLVGVVLYDLALLGAIVADGDGFFTAKIFPWLLVANPADAFRLVNFAASDATLLASGLASTSGAVPAFAPQIAVLLWPVGVLILAWSLFRRIEP